MVGYDREEMGEIYKDIVYGRVVEHIGTVKKNIRDNVELSSRYKTQISADGHQLVVSGLRDEKDFTIISGRHRGKRTR